MNPFEFASKYLKEYKQHGNELQALYCPYCQGGERRDKYTFALNVDKMTFNCKRASCSQKGTFWKLCQDFGEVADSDKMFEISRPERIYKKPQTKTQTPGQKVEAYLERRGFSKETWERRKVAEHNGNIAFPYYENGELVLMKFRRPEKYQGEGQKAWREKDGKAVFWGMDDCVFSLPLVIVEGEMDALTLDEADIPNVVSVPSGAEDLTCVDNCWEWIQKFNKIIIWPDNDIPGQEMCRKLISKLGAWRCWVVSVKYKDANEMLYREGKEAVWEAVAQAKEVPISGLVRLAHVKAFDFDSTARIRSSVKGINKIIGGYMMGQVSIWTGINSSGKSTFLGQELLTAIDQGFAVCAYSGELPGPVFRYWIEMQASGPKNLAAKYDAIREEEVFYPDRKVQELIRKWYEDKFFLCDSFGSVSGDSLLELFEYAARRYDCKMFLVDNLMNTIFTDDKDKYYQKQSEFVGKMVDFVHKYDVHIHIVAHPRKTTGRLTKMDVAGSGNITNLAHNVFSLHRLTEEESKEEGCDSLIDIFKNRFSGRQDVQVKLLFEERSKRFCMPSDSEEAYRRKYGWQEVGR